MSTSVRIVTVCVLGILSLALLVNSPLPQAQKSPTPSYTTSSEGGVCLNSALLPSAPPSSSGFSVTPIFYLKPYNLHLSVGESPTAQLEVYDDKGNEVASGVTFHNSNPNLISVSTSGVVTALRQESATEIGAYVHAYVNGTPAVNLTVVRVLSKDYQFNFREYREGDAVLYSPVDVLGENIDQYVTRYMIPKANALAVIDQFNLIGTTLFSGTGQIFAVDFGEGDLNAVCGLAGINPIRIGWNLLGTEWSNCYLVPFVEPRSPQWFIFYHELGHNTCLASDSFYRSFAALRNYNEGIPSYIAITSMDRLSGHSAFSSLSDETRTTIAGRSQVERTSWLNQFQDWLASGAPFSAITPSIVDGMLLYHEAQSQTCFRLRFFHLLRSEWVGTVGPLVDQITSTNRRHTFFAAMCSAAAMEDLRGTFVDDYHFPIDDSFYSQAYSALTTVPFPTSVELIFPVDGAEGIQTPLNLDWTDVAGAIAYDVYLGLEDPAQLFVSDLIVSELSSVDLAAGTTYRWRVVAKNGCTEDLSSSIGSFKTCSLSEVCNGLDDDCNGQVDEDLGQTTCGVGVCQQTTENCLNGVGQTCVPGSSSGEVCDDLDNDCDGVVDGGVLGTRELVADGAQDIAPAVINRSDGSLWLFWSRNAELLYQVSLDGGMTWGPVRLVGTGEDGGNFQADPVEGADGKLRLVFQSDRSGNSEIYYTVYDDASSVWLGPANLTGVHGDTVDDYVPSIVQTDGGELWVAYGHAVGPPVVQLARSADGGATWSPPVTIQGSEGGFNASLTKSMDGCIWLAYWTGGSVRYQKTCDEGANWTPQQLVAGTADGSGIVIPDIVEDSSGRIWVAWSHLLDGAHEIFYSTSTNSGETWTAPRRVTEHSAEDRHPKLGRVGSGLWAAFSSSRTGNDDIYLEELVYPVGQSCTVGLGACQRSGSLVCAPDGSGTVCSVTPGTPTPEICNGIDDDCDGPVDEEVTTLFCRDGDGDQYGDSGTSVQACSSPIGYVPDCSDCDDNDASKHPGSQEINDGRDNQCSGDAGFGVVDEVSGVAGFQNPEDNTEYSWLTQVGATRYEIVRSNSPDFSVACTMFETSEAFLLDPAVPLTRGIFHYVVRPIAPYVGSWGQDWSGAERTNIDQSCLQTPQTECEQAGGLWVDCGPTAPECFCPGISCPAVCVSECLCGGVAGYGCPSGKTCRVAFCGVADILGICL